MRLKFRSTLVVLVLFLLSVQIDRAEASVSLAEMMGTPLSHHGYSGRNLARGAEAVYFNPALLVGQRRSILTGTFVVHQRLDIGLFPRPQGVDVPESVYQARRLNEDGTTSRLKEHPLPTEALPRERGSHSQDPTMLFFSFGGVLPFWGGRVALGGYSIMPSHAFQTQNPQFADEREQFFTNSLSHERLADRLGNGLMAVGVGAEPISGLSIGLGAVLASDARSQNRLYVPDASDQENVLVQTQVKVHNRVVLHGGARAELSSRLSLTATVHGPYYNRVEGKSAMRFWTYPYPEGQDALHQDISYLYNFEPLRVGAGALWRSGEGNPYPLHLGLNALWARWSTYRDRHDQHPQDSWSDTVSLAMAMGAQAGRHRFSLDLMWAPSPVPEQQGRSNYVDNSRAGMALGLSSHHSVMGIGLLVGGHLGWQKHLYRESHKSPNAPYPVVDEFPDSVDLRTGEPILASAGLQTNNPGYPGFSSGGSMFTLGLSLRAVFP